VWTMANNAILSSTGVGNLGSYGILGL
jgi:hypothetical protein